MENDSKRMGIKSLIIAQMPGMEFTVGKENKTYGTVEGISYDQWESKVSDTNGDGTWKPSEYRYEYNIRCTLDGVERIVTVAHETPSLIVVWERECETAKPNGTKAINPVKKLLRRIKYKGKLCELPLLLRRE